MKSEAMGMAPWNYNDQGEYGSYGGVLDVFPLPVTVNMQALGLSGIRFSGTFDPSRDESQSCISKPPKSADELAEREFIYSFTF